MQTRFSRRPLYTRRPWWTLNRYNSTRPSLRYRTNIPLISFVSFRARRTRRPYFTRLAGISLSYAKSHSLAIASQSGNPTHLLAYFSWRSNFSLRTPRAGRAFDSDHAIWRSFNNGTGRSRGPNRPRHSWRTRRTRRAFFARNSRLNNSEGNPNINHKFNQLFVREKNRLTKKGHKPKTIQVEKKSILKRIQHYYKKTS